MATAEYLNPRFPLLDGQGLSEIPRPYTEFRQLTFKGEQLLLDEGVVLAFAVDYMVQRKRLFITRDKTTPVTVIKEDGSERTFAFFDPEKVKDPFVTVRVGFNHSHPLLYIGRDYRLTFERFLGDIEHLKFKLESTARIEANPVSGKTNPILLLEGLSRVA